GASCLKWGVRGRRDHGRQRPRGGGGQRGFRRSLVRCAERGLPGLEPFRYGVRGYSTAPQGWEDRKRGRLERTRHRGRCDGRGSEHGVSATELPTLGERPES